MASHASPTLGPECARTGSLMRAKEYLFGGKTQGKSDHVSFSRKVLQVRGMKVTGERWNRGIVESLNRTIQRFHDPTIQRFNDSFAQLLHKKTEEQADIGDDADRF